MESQPRIDLIPWFEHGDPKGGDLRKISAALADASRFCRFAYVITSAWRSDIYAVFRADPAIKLRVIPGFKVSNSMPGKIPFHDRGVWHDLAAEAHRTARASGVGTLVIEAEHKLLEYWVGQMTIDHAQLTRSLEQLPDLEYIWYPGGLGIPDMNTSNVALPHAKEYWKSVQAGLRRVKFTTTGLCNNPVTRNMPWIIENDNALRAMARVKPQESIYLDPNGERFWAFADIKKAVALMSVRDAYLWAADMNAMLAAVAPLMEAR